jgi:hypothetical protein
LADIKDSEPDKKLAGSFLNILIGIGELVLNLFIYNMDDQKYPDFEYQSNERLSENIDYFDNYMNPKWKRI